jgi:hypothetical protein
MEKRLDLAQRRRSLRLHPQSGHDPATAGPTARACYVHDRAIMIVRVP